MKQQKLYKYNKPSENAEKKAPLILCYANNEAHAMQLLRERFQHEDGTYEHIDKSLIQEYVMQKKEDKNKKKKYPKKVDNEKSSKDNSKKNK